MSRHINIIYMFIILIFIFSSCSHFSKNTPSTTPSTTANTEIKEANPSGKMALSTDNKKYYLNDASESEVYDEVVELDDNFENNISFEDQKLLKEIMESNAIDLKFGANYDIPIEMNPQVIYFIRYFQTRGRVHFERWLKNGETAIPYIRNLLKENGMPEDLVFVAMIESGFSPRAYSRAKAVGPWQFMRGTAIKYDMKVNWWLDERRDLTKATLAAVSYLKQLYQRYNNWYLAVAAYNAGEGKIDRAIERFKTKDYWELCRYRYIREETKNYVPKMIAAALIVKNPQEYGFAKINYTDVTKFKKVTIPKPTDLYNIASHLGTNYDLLKDLNPELLRWCTPPDMPNYVLTVPDITDDQKIATLKDNVKEVSLTFRRHKVRHGDNLWSISKRYNINVSQLMQMNKISHGSRLRIGQSLIIPIPGQKMPQEFHKTSTNQQVMRSKIFADTIPYIVKKGDTLFAIATQFNLKPQVIKEYNPKLRRNSQVLFGETLLIPVTKAKDATTLEVTKESIPQTQNNPANTTISQDQPAQNNNPKLEEHEVKSGENLSSIARQYNTTVSEIIAANKIDKDIVLKPGDKIYIEKK